MTSKNVEASPYDVKLEKPVFEMNGGELKRLAAEIGFEFPNEVKALDARRDLLSEALTEKNWLNVRKGMYEELDGLMEMDIA